MVFKKNIMLKLFILLKFFLLLGGCAYNLDIISTENLLQNEINKKILNNLEAWAWQKFATEGIENKAFLNLLKINTGVIEKKKNKKSIISIINQGKKVYKIILNFDLSITTNDRLMKTLKITSSLDFTLLNKYSITQRDKAIIYNVDKLIKLIDDKVTFQLSNKAFDKFVIK